jgi:hypothetical protein
VRLDKLTRRFIEFTEAPNDQKRRASLQKALTASADEAHWVKAATKSWLNSEPPGDEILLVRLETELLRLKAAVELQLSRIPAGEAGRVGELLVEQVDGPLIAKHVEADLHFFVVAAAAVFACARSASSLLGLSQPAEPPTLRAARNISQHIEEYTVGKGRDASVWRQRVQTWRLRNEDGRPVWTWAGIEIDVKEVSEQAIRVADSLVGEIAGRVPKSARGEYLLVTLQSDDEID